MASPALVPGRLGDQVIIVTGVENCIGRSIAKRIALENALLTLTHHSVRNFSALALRPLPDADQITDTKLDVTGGLGV